MSQNWILIVEKCEIKCFFRCPVLNTLFVKCKTVINNKLKNVFLFNKLPLDYVSVVKTILRKSICHGSRNHGNFVQ